MLRHYNAMLYRIARMSGQGAPSVCSGRKSKGWESISLDMFRKLSDRLRRFFC